MLILAYHTNTSGLYFWPKYWQDLWVIPKFLYCSKYYKSSSNILSANSILKNHGLENYAEFYTDMQNMGPKILFMQFSENIWLALYRIN